MLCVRFKNNQNIDKDTKWAKLTKAEQNISNDMHSIYSITPWFQLKQKVGWKENESHFN